MKVAPPLALGISLVAIAISILSNVRAADAPNELEGFRQKIAAEEAKQKQKSPYGERGLSMQIKLLQSLIAREDYDRALQTMESLSGYGMPAEFQEDWMALSGALSKELKKKKTEHLEKWSNEIDQLVKDTKDGCVAAKTSNDLDSLLMRCSALQMRIQSGNSVMSERITRRLSGVGDTLSTWSDYLDFKNAGNVKNANERLRSLLSNSSSLPVLTSTDIESRLTVEPGANMNTRSLLAGIFKNVKSPDDLPAVLEQLKVITENPLYQSVGDLRTEQSRTEGYIQAWKAAEAGDAAEVYRALSRTDYGSTDTQSYYAPFKALIESRLVSDKAAAWTKLTPQPDESSASYLGRILAELKAKSDYATMGEVLEFSTRLTRNGSPASSTDHACIEQYLAGKRLEDAGDGLAAIANYRRAVASPQSKYTPTVEAQDALKRLSQKYPDAFKDQNAVLSEQIRMLSEQMQMLGNQLRTTPVRPTGRPY